MGAVMRYIMILFLIMGFSSHAFCGENAESSIKNYILQADNDTFNWTKGRIIAAGSASMPEDLLYGERALRASERNALIKARKKLLNALLNINVNSSLTIQDLVQNDSKASDSLRALVHQSLVWETVYYHHPENRVEVHVFVDLWDEDARRLLPDSAFSSPQWDGGGSWGAVFLLGCDLVLDAREYGARPALVPSFTDSEGNVIFRASVLGDGPWSKKSPVRYLRAGDEQVFESERDRIVFKPRGISGRQGSDFVLSEGDIILLKEILDHFSADCQVNIIMR